MRVVILGGGFGGVYAAQSLASCGLSPKRFDVVLISRNPSFEFKPLFTEVLGGRLSPEAVSFPLHNMLPESQCEIRIAEVQGIDVKKRIVATDDGDVPFDYLVIGLGGYPDFVPTAPGTKLFSMESLDECIELRDRIQDMIASARKKKETQKSSIAILGAGPTGVEVALETWSLMNAGAGSDKKRPREGRIEVSLVEAAPQILPGWSRNLRNRAEELLDETTVNVLTGVSVNRIGKQRLTLKGRTTVPAATTVWAGGLKGLPLFESTGTPLDEKGRLRVNSRLQLPRSGRIFAMGDGINTEAFTTPVPQSAQAAYQQAQLVAANIRNSVEGRPLKELRYFDYGEAMPVGGRQAIARILGIPIEGFAAWTLEKAIFLLRIPGLDNKLRLLNELTIEPLAKRGEEYLERRRRDR